MIVVFGSATVDLNFPTARLPLPGETVLCPAYDLGPGGKGANQAVAAARAGAATRFIGCVGRDAFGEVVTRALDTAGVDIAGLARVDRPTACAAIAVAGGGENMILVATGANALAEASQVPDRLLGPSTTLLLQLEVPVAASAAVARRARARGARVVLNAAPAAPLPADLVDALDILVANEGEAAAIAAGLGLGAGSDPLDAGRRLWAATGRTVVVTLGAEGSVAFGPEGAWRVAAPTVRAVDTVGAGDAYVGALAAALDTGAAFPDALRRASVAGGLACTRVGAMAALPDAAAIGAALPGLAPAQAIR